MRTLRKLRRHVWSRSGQGLVEYSFLLVLVLFVTILVLRGIGGQTNDVYSSANDGFNQ